MKQRRETGLEEINVKEGVKGKKGREGKGERGEEVERD